MLVSICHQCCLHDQNYLIRSSHLIHQAAETELHSYLSGICNKLECQVIKVGGYSDHIHILCMLSTKNNINEIIGATKITFFEMDKNKRR